MGQRLVAFFDEADRLDGMLARMRLASLTRVTSTQAATLEDSPILISRFESALERMRGERPSKPDEPARPRTPDGSRKVGMLRRQIATYLDLMTQRALFLGSVADTIRRVTEAAASVLEVDRVSVWMLDPAQSKITCADLFERPASRHSGGAVLQASDYPSYFAALRTQRTIAAHDAHGDPRTSCFSKSYLEPLSINSMLDVPIWSAEKMVGVVCHEHVGPARTWDADEETFAYLMASFVSLAMDGAAPRRP
jgi:hypothetical protein